MISGRNVLSAKNISRMCKSKKTVRETVFPLEVFPRLRGLLSAVFVPMISKLNRLTSSGYRTYQISLRAFKVTNLSAFTIECYPL